MGVSLGRAEVPLLKVGHQPPQTLNNPQLCCMTQDSQNLNDQLHPTTIYNLIYT